MLEPTEGQEVRFVCTVEGCGFSFWQRWLSGDTAKNVPCFMHGIDRPQMEMTEVRDVAAEREVADQ